MDHNNQTKFEHLKNFCVIGKFEQCGFNIQPCVQNNVDHVHGHSDLGLQCQKLWIIKGVQYEKFIRSSKYWDR